MVNASCRKVLPRDPAVEEQRPSQAEKLYRSGQSDVSEATNLCAGTNTPGCQVSLIFPNGLER
jgi:hypothetical protein